MYLKFQAMRDVRELAFEDPRAKRVANILLMRDDIDVMQNDTKNERKTTNTETTETTTNKSER